MLTYPYISYQISLFHAAPVVTLFFSLTHVSWIALHHTVVIRYSTSVTYWVLCHASVHLMIYRECYRFERAFFPLRRFFTLHSFLPFQGFPGAGSSTSKLPGVHTDLQNIAPARLFAWITAIHKSFTCARFYLKATNGQTRNINLHGKLVLRNISFEIFASYRIWTLFAIRDYIRRILP